MAEDYYSNLLLEVDNAREIEQKKCTCLDCKWKSSRYIDCAMYYQEVVECSYPPLVMKDRHGNVLKKDCSEINKEGDCVFHSSSRVASIIKVIKKTGFTSRQSFVIGLSLGWFTLIIFKVLLCVM